MTESSSTEYVPFFLLPNTQVRGVQRVSNARSERIAIWKPNLRRRRDVNSAGSKCVGRVDLYLVSEA